MDRDDYDLGSRPLVDAAMSDSVELIGRKASPGISLTTSVMEPSTHYRRHSRGYSADERLKSIDGTESMRDEPFELIEPPSPPKDRRPSTGQSGPASVLRRLTTKIKPMSRAAFRSTKRSKGREYATLDDGDNVHDPTVDLSSLEGMGWELTDLSNSDTFNLHDQDTEYVRPEKTDRKPDFRTFVDKRSSVGYGMKGIGVQLRRDPTRIVRRGTSGVRGAESSALDRSKTVKDFGQNLAQEKNMIVEVEEVVDLSSLEGGRSDTTRNSTFESMSMRQSVLPQETKSYFFPEDPDIPNWKPWSMRSWYILSLIVLALALGGFQELLCQKSFKSVKDKSGILAFNATADISTWDFFAWKCKLTFSTTPCCC